MLKKELTIDEPKTEIVDKIIDQIKDLWRHILTNVRRI